MDRSVAEAQNTVPQPLRSPCKSSTLVAERCFALSGELLSGPSSWRSYFELGRLCWRWFSIARPAHLGGAAGWPPGSARQANGEVASRPGWLSVFTPVPSSCLMQYRSRAAIATQSCGFEMILGRSWLCLGRDPPLSGPGNSPGGLLPPGPQNCPPRCLLGGLDAALSWATLVRG